MGWSVQKGCSCMDMLFTTSFNSQIHGLVHVVFYEIPWKVVVLVACTYKIFFTMMFDPSFKWWER